MAWQDFALRPTNEPLQVHPGEDYRVTSFYSNVPEDEYPAWVAATAYAAEARVIHKHRVYRAVSESTGVEPGTETTFPAKWQDIGPTNPLRMFDEKVSTKTTNPELIEVTITPGTPFDSAAFFGVDAGGVRVQAIDPYRGIIFDDQVAPVSTDGINNWYAYLFAPIEIIEDFVVSGIGASAFATLKISISKIGGVASVGSAVIGSSYELGCAQYGTSVGIRDFSRKERDEFGNYIVVERGFSKWADFDVEINARDISRVQRTLAKYRARPVVWIGTEEIEATIIYGYYKDFSIVIANPATSDCTISVEGLN